MKMCDKLLIWSWALTLTASVFVEHACAATNTAASCSLSAVTAAIAASSDGDTVIVPAGSATWESAITVTKAISIIGAGTNSTFITSGSGDYVLDFSPSNDKPIRLSKFNFSISNTSHTLVYVGATHSPVTAFRVDHCWFNRGARALYAPNYCYGVIDHCTFVNSPMAIGLDADNDTSWSRPIVPGTTNTVVIEDNLFRIDGSYADDFGDMILQQQGSRACTRFNTFDATGNTHNACWWESHGNEGYVTDPVTHNPTSPPHYRGQPLLELYGNTFTHYTAYRLFQIRGGSTLAYSNTVTQTTGSRPAYFYLWEEEAWQTAFFNPLRTVWPADDQITNTFFWANTYNGSAVTASDVYFDLYPNPNPFIQENRDFWMQAPNSTNGRPAGIYSSYTPLVYPHPRVKAEDKPQPPKNLRVVTP